MVTLLWHYVNVFVQENMMLFYISSCFAASCSIFSLSTRKSNLFPLLKASITANDMRKELREGNEKQENKNTGYFQI